MTIRRPSLADLREISKKLKMSISDNELLTYIDLMEPNFQAYDVVDALEDDTLRSGAEQYRSIIWPRKEDNLENAWYVKTEINVSDTGLLAGKTIALKDNVCVRGVPMMNGASTLRGYIPEIDATIVSRILENGGTLLGKANCEYLCLSGGSHTCANGPVENPWRSGYSAGGSSSGSAVLVAQKEVDMSIGCDQGGSIRIPSSFCGVYGMKPTYGLVPYTGIMPIEATVDYAGPITSTVSDNALLLEVIAGYDGLDPRQCAREKVKYTDTLDAGIQGLRIGVLREAFLLPNMEEDVALKVKGAADRLRRLGATVDEISIPAHLSGLSIWTPIILEGLQMQMMHGNSTGFNWRGYYNTDLILRQAHWRERADELSPTLKLSMLVGEYFLDVANGFYYGKAQNLSRKLTAAYEKAFESCDLLLMPTLPIKATLLPGQHSPLNQVVARAFEMIGNTAPFNVTGHPAMSIPCGLSEGLPVGLMLVSSKWRESNIYRAAFAFEQSGDWTSFG